MARTTTPVDLERLNQAQAAWLVGKPAVWLRDNAHLADRNEDGTYDARGLVSVIQGELMATDFTDAQLEPVLQLAESFACHCEYTRPAVIRILERIKRRHGAAGMAAFGEEILRQCVRMSDRFDDRFQEPKPTPELIRQKAEREIAALPMWDARKDLRIVLLCERCRRHRWGRSWREGEIPHDYVSLGDVCPDCEPQD